MEIKIEPFFEEWEDGWTEAAEYQERYELRVVELTEFMIETHPDYYVPKVHDKIIRETARQEIICEHYNKQISNNREGSGNVVQILKNQWQQLERNRKILQINVKDIAIVKGKKIGEDQKSTGAKEDLCKMMQEAVEEGDI